jgi:hypothetical protein
LIPEGVTVCVPIALFFETVRLEDASVSALPFADPVEAFWLEVKPCTLLVLPERAARIVVKTAVDWTSPRSVRTRVVFAGTT